MTSKKRHWCAKVQYEGKEEFLVGTVWAEQEHEAEHEMYALIDKILPLRPRILALVPGYLRFHEEAE